ncbi:putative quinol monooxygenase [Rhodococcus sp. NPDC057014]|uniref:putative quinol monooxygenase n=1 Tax=Rhodococcus sp. NPDC057014 TaxID=3346000 RepID=UPI0036341269
MSYTVLVTLDVRPDHVDDFIDGITDNARASLRDEPGCLIFDVHRDNIIPTRFHLYEVYTDEDAFTVVHRSAPHYARWQRVAARCLIDGGHRNTFATPVHLGAAHVRPFRS